MKNSSKILSGLFLAVLCTTAISIAETYSTTTTTTKYTRPVTTRTVTTTTSPTTVTSTTIDATTNPMYSVNRNDKIQQYQGSNSSTPKTTTTTTQYSRPVTTRTTTTTTQTPAKSTSSGNVSREQQIMNDLQSQAKGELDYYEKLKTCTPASLESNNLALKTYGMSNGLCNFDIKALNPKTNQMTTLCTFNVPAESAKKFANDKLRYERSLVGLEKLTTDEYTEITTNLTMFTRENCKQAK